MAQAKNKTPKKKTNKKTKVAPVKNNNTTKKTTTKKNTPKKPKGKTTVVLVYANWCHHCQTMKPEWNEMKNRIGTDIETIEIEDSDFDKDMKLQDIKNSILNGEHVNIIGYPTMFKIQNGHADYYGGSRNASDMINWAKSYTGGYVKSKIKAMNRSIRSK